MPAAALSSALDCPEVKGTFLERAARAVSEKPEDQVFARWFDSKGDVEDVRTYKGIWNASGEVSYQLRVKWGLRKGDRVILAFNFGLRFFPVFLGCLRAGVVAVPVYPPSPATLNKSLRGLQLIVDSCQPKLILVCPAVNKLRQVSKLNVMSSASKLWPDVLYKCPDVREEPGAGSSLFAIAGKLSRAKSTGQPQMENSFDDPSMQPDDVAFLQFTSGSTSDPKGVMITFGNLEHNVEAIITLANEEARVRGGLQGGEMAWFSWLPTFHDMGLIQGTLAPFVAGWRAGYMSPITFIRRPLLWLQLMSSERSTFTSAPNFALSLCVRKWQEATPAAREALQLDLNACLGVQNSAEPVRVSTVRDFGAAFAEVGLRSSYPIVGYGLAEHVVCVGAFTPNPTEAPLDSIPDNLLRVCISTTVTSMLGIEVKIVDPESRRELPIGATGELWLKSPSVAAGYWGKPELSRETFCAHVASKDNGSGGPYLRTGDLCRIDAAGHIFVEGRLKDVIIVNGRNLYPQDIECVVQDSTPAVRPGCIAAFSTTELGGNLEVVAEIRKAVEDKAGAVLEALQTVRRAVVDESGLLPSRVVAIKERSIPKTTSGKIQRRLTRTMLHEGELAVIHEISSESRVPTVSTTKEDIHDEQNGSNGNAVVLVTEKPFLGEVKDSGNPERVVSSGPYTSLTIEDVTKIVEKATGIEGVGHTDDLLDLGVDSSTAVGISSDLSEACGRDLPAELVFGHTTVQEITDYVASLEQAKEKTAIGTSAQGGATGVGVQHVSEGKTSHTTGIPGSAQLIDGDEQWMTGPMRGLCFRVLQTMMLVLVIAQTFACMLPARTFLLHIRELSRAQDGIEARVVLNLLLALAPVTWFATYTALLVTIKWVVLGRCFQGRIPLSSPTYLAWWYVNTTLKVWERTGGWWLLDTRVLVLVYRLLGAHIAWTAKIKYFIGDFDMVEIGDGASVEGVLLTRRFDPCCMIVQRLSIGDGASIGAGAVVYGATKIGAHSVVRPQCVIPPQTDLPASSIWEGHPATEVKGMPDAASSTTPALSCSIMDVLLEVTKVAAILATLLCVAGFGGLFNWAFGSFGLSGSFRYMALVRLTFVIGGTIVSFAAFTVAMKWILAGAVKEGEYTDNALCRFRRWYLLKLQIAVSAYFLVFNRMRLYDWWSAAVGMRVGAGSWVLFDTALCNLEDAHLVKIGSGSVVSYANLTVDRAIGREGKREKRAITIGSRSLAGYRSYLGAGASIGDGAMMAGFAAMKAGETLPDGTATMSNSSSMFRITTSRVQQSTTSETTGDEKTDLPGMGLFGGTTGCERLYTVFIDIITSFGSWLLNGLALVGAYEVSRALLSVPILRDNAAQSFLVVGTAVVIAWIVIVGVLVVVYKWIVVGNLRHMSTEKELIQAENRQGGSNGNTATCLTPEDMEAGVDRTETRRRPAGRHTAAQLMRWRKFDSTLRSTLFESYIYSLVQGTWLMNVWLRAMGANVSMGSLILGLVKDYDMITVSEGAVVAGFVVGHRYTLLNEEIALDMMPTTVGPCAVVDAHSVLRGASMEAATTLVAGSVTVNGQTLKTSQVYGGRPPKKLGANWVI